MTARRIVLKAGLGLAIAPLAPAARATPESMKTAIDAFTGARAPRDGRVTLDIAPLIDNGNVVPVTIRVQSAMSASDFVQRIGLFTAANPLPEAAVFHLGPRNGRAEVSTRMRLATSQTVTAIALMNDGSVWQEKVDVVVALAACIEG
jgi:sulfur-oxidizing protein SoxY